MAETVEKDAQAVAWDRDWINKHMNSEYLGEYIGDLIKIGCLFVGVDG